MKLILLAIMLMLTLLSGCNPDGSPVSINTSGIFSQVLFSIDGNDLSGKTVDIGEHVLTDEPRVMTVRINNSTKFPYTEIDLVITADADNVPAIGFVPNAEGEIKFPGDQGTCQRTLAAGSSCTIKLLFAPRDERRYFETLTLKFKNYVDPETHVGNVKAIAGMPASLAFTNDKTQYTFGDLVGPSKIAVVERQDKLTYTQELEVVNAGGLPAKNLNITLSQLCQPLNAAGCPDGAENAYSMVSTCPARLEPKEKCQATITYFPKNFDPDDGSKNPAFKEINYRGTVTFAYVKDPRGTQAAMNAYFKSLSTNIEAKFKTPITGLSYEDPVIAGNRETRSFRISNLGYREGELRSIDIRDSGGSFIASCRAPSLTAPDPLLLECVDTNKNPVPLDKFPFRLKDKTNCLRTPSEDPVYVEVGEGCVFDLVFQPSITFVKDKNSEFQNLQPEVVFDSRWRGKETITKNNIFLLSAKSIAPARLELTKVSYNAQDYAPAGTPPLTVDLPNGTSPYTVDLQRLALQSSRFFKRRSMLLMFQNKGTAPATELSIKDASGRTIPVGGTSVNLGAKLPYFYSGVLASDSNCTEVKKDEVCSISLQFAPIGMDTNIEEDANMFDATDAIGDRFKGFRITYKTGATYTDVNISGDPDYPPQVVEARLKATLIRKGLLMQLSDDTRNVNNIGGQINVADDTVTTKIFLQNIGTGSIPYIRLLTPPIAPIKNVTLLPTANPQDFGAEYDCLGLVDMDLTKTVPETASPSTRLGLFQGLPKEESCVYTVQFKYESSLRHYNPTSCLNGNPATTRDEEGTRLFNQTLASSGTELWQVCDKYTNAINWDNIRVRYYDGDASDPKLPPGSTYGAAFNLNTYTYVTNFTTPGKLIPHSFLPWLGATLYRPGFTYPTLSATQLSQIIPEYWFYGPSQNFYYLMNEAAQTSPFIKGNESRNFVPTLNAFANRANYDYVLYLGAFPQGSGTVNVPLMIKNYGKFRAKVTSLNLNPDPAFSYNSTMVPVLPHFVAGNADINPFSVNFNPNSPGEKWLEMNITYEDGAHTAPLIYDRSKTPSNLGAVGNRERTLKILVVGYVLETGTYPQLSVSSQDYEVTQNYLAPPTETPLAVVSAPTSWNTSPTTTTLVFDTLKLTATPTVNDVYAKKRLVFTNNTGFPIQDFRILYRSDVTASTTKNPSVSFKTVAAQTTCTGGMTLNAGASCAMTLTYQPGSSDVADTFVMTAIYRAATGIYLMQNLTVNLSPRSPGLICVAPSGTTCATRVSISYKATSTSATVPRSSIPLTFNTTVLDSVPKTIAFNQTSGGFSRVRVINNQRTKASLLLSYHRYLEINNLRGYSSTNKPPTSVVPLASEYRTVGGLQYARIHRNEYPDKSDRIVIEATKGCLFGEDETNNAITHDKKGFNNATSSSFPCFLIVTFNANFEYLNKNILGNNGDDMRGTASELWYYSVNRSSTDSIWIHVIGLVNPDDSLASGSYGNIAAADNRMASFSLPKFQPRNASVGSVVGIRVLVAPSSSVLNSPYSNISTYVDIRPYDPVNVQFANFTTLQGLANGSYSYFRAVAIRKDTRFVDGTPKRFVNLQAGEYLSLASNNGMGTPLKVLIPPSGFFYFHNQKIVVEKNLVLANLTYELYGNASSRCTTRSFTFKDPGNVVRSFTLINRTVWNLLLANPSATGYNNMSSIPHWMSDAPVSIDTTFGSLSGFLAGQASQKLPASGAYYLRNSSNPSASVNQAMGGILGSQTDSNYRSLVPATIPFGVARCMITVP